MLCTYNRSIQMNFPVNVLPSESVVLIRLPRSTDFVYSNEAFFRCSDTGGGDIDDDTTSSSSQLLSFIVVSVV